MSRQKSPKTCTYTPAKGAPGGIDDSYAHGFGIHPHAQRVLARGAPTDGSGVQGAAGLPALEDHDQVLVGQPAPVHFSGRRNVDRVVSDAPLVRGRTSRPQLQSLGDATLLVGIHDDVQPAPRAQVEGDLPKLARVERRVRAHRRPRGSYYGQDPGPRGDVRELQHAIGRKRHGVHAPLVAPGVEEVLRKVLLLVRQQAQAQAAPAVDAHVP